MKKYLLLRNNQESGPFEFSELIKQELQPFDLIWIEGESTSWKYAGEMDDLEQNVKKQTSRPAAKSEKKVYVSLPTINKEEDLPLINKPLPEPRSMETEFLMKVPAFKERPDRGTGKRPIWRRKLFYANEALQLAAVFVGLVLGAVLIKKAADDSVTEEEVVQPANNMVIDEPKTGITYQNALVKEVVIPAASERPQTRSARPKDIRGQVSLRTNDFKTGVFGGISDLQLTVSNSSPHFIDKMEVKVDFQKKNGQVIESKKFTIRSLAPYSKQKIDVPQNRRGTRVKTSVGNIYSKEYTAALMQA